ncbi:MAG: sulfate permease [Nannocystaceae bacterium]|nr:sulfate permease [Nannocystaceae bacterium]
MSPGTSTSRAAARVHGLGWSRLWPQWRAMLQPRDLAPDAIAGLTVALTAIPLSMAIAIASGVAPIAGLITAVVAGVVAALFGGSAWSVSGPAAAMAVLLASIVEEHGVAGLALASLLAAALQLLTGMLGLGRVARLVPLPVVVGFTGGIGVIIFVGQLPRALGLPAPDQAHVVDVVTHIGELIEHASIAAVGLALTAFLLVVVSGRIGRKIPGALLAVITATVAAEAMGLEVERVGPLPLSSLSWPSLHPGDIDWTALVGDALVIYALASLETLLSAGAVDRLARSVPHDPNQELVGQGLANLAAVAAGGLLGTAVIARSGLNVAAGARTRRAALLHGVLVAVLVLSFAPIVARVPLAALAGILLAIAVGMLAPAELVSLWRQSRTEAAVCLATLFTMVAFDLVVGVRVGVIAALAIAAFRHGRTDATVQPIGEHGPYRFTLRGPLTFLGMSRLDELRAALPQLQGPRGIVLDLAEVPSVDVSAGDALAPLLSDIERRAIAFALIARRPVLEVLARHDRDGRWAARVVADERAALRLLGAAEALGPEERLRDGVARFQAVARDRHQALFEHLAKGQSPHTLFVACADSRVSPLLITSAEPGEVFVHRNVGNIVPPPGGDDMPAEGAAVEYAVGVLGVKQIVVCGHSGCGAMAAIAGGVPPGLPSVERWLGFAAHVRDRVPLGASPEALARANVLIQLENLRRYEVVRAALERGALTLQAWYYDIAAAEVEAWDAERGAFTPLSPPQAASA